MTVQHLIRYLLLAVVAGVLTEQGTGQTTDRTDETAQRAEEAVTEEEGATAVDQDATTEGEEKAQRPRRGRAYLLGITLTKGEDGWPRAADVRPLTPAWDAGVRKGDVIKQTDGVSTKPYEDWLETIRLLAREKKKGDFINFEIERDDAQLSIRVGSRGEEEEKAGIPDNNAHLREETRFQDQDPLGYPQGSPPPPPTGEAAPPATAPGGQPITGGPAYGVGVPIGGGVVGGQSLNGQDFESGQDMGESLPRDDRLEGQVLSGQQLEELNRLQQLSEQGELSPQQRERFQRLQQLQEAGAFARESGSQPVGGPPVRPLTPNQARRLRQLEQGQLDNRLSPRQTQELQRLQSLQQSRQFTNLSPQQRQQLMQLYGQNSGLLSPQQQNRLQQLQEALRSGQLDQNLRQELSRLQMQQDMSLRQNLANEFQQLQGLNQQSLSPAQQQRFQQLQQQQQFFGSPGAGSLNQRPGGAPTQLPAGGGYVPPGPRPIQNNPVQAVPKAGGAAGPANATGGAGGGATGSGATSGGGAAGGAAGGATGGASQ